MNKSNSLFQRLKWICNESLLRYGEELNRRENNNITTVDIPDRKLESGIMIHESILSELESPYVLVACNEVEKDLLKSDSIISNILKNKEIRWSNAYKTEDKIFDIPNETRCKGLWALLGHYLLWARLDQVGISSFEDYFNRLQNQKTSDKEHIESIFIERLTVHKPIMIIQSDEFHGSPNLALKIDNIAKMLEHLILLPRLSEKTLSISRTNMSILRSQKRASWSEYKFVFQDVRNLKVTKGLEEPTVYSYEQLGMMNKKNNKSTSMWFVFCCLALLVNDKIDCVTEVYDKNTSLFTKQVQLLNGHLKKFFRVNENPFVYNKCTRKYEERLKQFKDANKLNGLLKK